MIANPEAALGDFDVDREPSLFIDNWGVDVVARYSDQLRQPIKAAVALAELLTALRDGQPVSEMLDPDVLEGTIFVDGSDGKSDHFFGMRLAPRSERGTYAGPRVAAKFITGLVRLNRLAFDSGDRTYATSNERWSTLNSNGLTQRPVELFGMDTDRLMNVHAFLERKGSVADTNKRPVEWPGEIADPSAYQAGLEGLHGVKQVIYVGRTPLEDVAPEPERKIFIPFLDN